MYLVIVSIHILSKQINVHIPLKKGKYCNSLVWAVPEELFPSWLKGYTHGFQFVFVRTPLDFCIAATEMPINTSPASKGLCQLLGNKRLAIDFPLRQVFYHIKAVKGARNIARI
jgi:hypothetical protein